MNKVKKTGFLVIILGMVSMLPPLAIDMYLPAFIDIATELAVSQAKVQTTLAIFTLGFAIGQLFWGPIADSVGRKPTILLGLLGATVSAFLLTCVTNIEHFYWLRLIQGLCGAAPAVVSAALIRDLFTRDRFARVMSMVMIVSMVAPLLAPILGGYLAKWFHWHSIFYTLVFMGILCLFCIFYCVPETLQPEHKQSIQLSKILQNVIRLISHHPTLGYVLCGAFAFSGMFCFLTSGSLIYIGIYHIPAENFGYFFILNISVMMIMTVINGRWVTQLGSTKMLHIGLGLQFIAGIWLFLSATFSLGFWSMALGVAVFVGMVSTIGSNAVAAILDHYPHMAGTANAIAGTARFGIASLVSVGLSYMPLTSERPMLYFMMGCSLISVLTYYFLSHQRG